uniref:Uncharacterized protein n=1 Tax=Haplochromis burtoni TaxID=8153 RepID=A0A3Q3CGR0_HAPBU
QTPQNTERERKTKMEIEEKRWGVDSRAATEGLTTQRKNLAPTVPVSLYLDGLDGLCLWSAYRMRGNAKNFMEAEYDLCINTSAMNRAKETSM